MCLSETTFWNGLLLIISVIISIYILIVPFIWKKFLFGKKYATKTIVDMNVNILLFDSAQINNSILPIIKYSFVYRQ